jgi:hypothetical protein
MSTEQDKNKTMIDDEKFINELYAELENDLTNFPDEQPSESLDQSILAASRQAIGSNPKAEKTKTEKPSGVKKSRVWHVPFSLAASTVLVVSLVVNQGEESQLPKEPAISEPIVIQSNMQYNRAVSTKSEAISEKKMMAEVKRRKFAKQEIRQPEKMTITPVQLAKKKSIKADIELFALAEEVFVRSELVQSDYAPTVVNKSNSGLKRQSPAHRLSQNFIIPWLSYQQYLSFREQNSQCSLLEETEGYYLISIYIAESNFSQYKLKKKEFNIISLPNDTETKFLFEQIKLLNK